MQAVVPAREASSWFTKLIKGIANIFRLRVSSSSVIKEIQKIKEIEFNQLNHKAITLHSQYLTSSINVIKSSTYSYFHGLQEKIKGSSENHIRELYLSEADYNNLKTFIKQADMTINFRCFRYFLADLPADDTPSAQGILNYWENPDLDRDPQHRQTRDNVEKTLFEVSNNPLAQRESQQGENNRYAIGCSERPIYSALNICRFSKGGAPAYGNSFMKLKKSVKDASSFIGHDSFDRDRLGNLKTPKDLATFEYPAALMRELQPFHLQELKNAIDRQVDELELMSEHTDYIECHIHKPLEWKDIEEITVDFEDLKEAKIDDISTLIALPEDTKNRYSRLLRNNPDIFNLCCEKIKTNAKTLEIKHGLSVKFINESLI